MTTRAKSKGTAEDYIRKLPARTKEIAEAIVELIEKAAPKAEAKLKWSMPWWELEGGNLCYIAAYSDRINFGFPDGAEFDDPDGLLEGTGKGMRHIKVRALSDINKTKFMKLIKQAVKLNREMSSA